MVNQNYEFFLNTNLDEFTGQWVAIVDKKLVAHGKAFSEVFKQVKLDFPSKTPFIAMVPSKVAMIY